MKAQNRIIGVLFILVCFTGSACDTGGVAVTPVEGVIKLNGKPAANLLLQVSPAEGHDGRALSASAISDATGRFVLKCDNGRAGAPIGKHKVTVVDNNLATEEEPGKAGARTPTNRVPGQFASVATTPLELVVEAGKKDYEINLRTGAGN